MSATPTPSVSSDQTRYYDALDMQFPQTDDTAGERPGSSPADPRLGAAGNQSGASRPFGNEETDTPSEHADDEAGQKNPSIRSLPTVDAVGQEKQTSGMRAIFGGAGGTAGRKESIREARSTHATATTSAFANGAPLMGPDAEPDVDENLFARGAKAERSLSQKQKDRIEKEERKESKKFSKLLKMESTTEKVALDSALRNLSALQGLHKAAIQRETRAEGSYARSLCAAQKAEGRFQEEKARASELRARAEARCAEERARWEGKEGEVVAQQERLGSAKDTVREMETRISECAREVERLRIVKAADEREREARLIELAGQK